MHQFIKQALTGDNQWWKYIVTIFTVFFFIQVGTIPLIYVAYTHAADINEFMLSAQSNFMNLGINSNLFLFWMIFSFVVGLITLFVCVKWIHNRFIKTIITSRNSVDWRRILFGFMVWGFVAVGTILVQINTFPENYEWNFKLVPFLILVGISLLFIPFQTTLEELLFRGYLMQGLGLLFRSSWMPLLITSVGFGLLHGANPEVEKLGSIVMIYYIGTGFMFGITTLMDEGAELAIGMHAANNIIAAVLVTSDWMVFQTEALYKDISEPIVNMEALFPVLVVYPILLLIFAKKYKWNQWSERLFGMFSVEN
ncbi:MAG: CPBP family intramembrane metalloprotease [Flavobacteriaceae bacterium]|nr:CPBP family intramembrane metalloprotease [Flavobacteriaceae bacterium]